MFAPVKSERVFSDFRKAEGSSTVFVFERLFSRDGRESASLVANRISTATSVSAKALTSPSRTLPIPVSRASPNSLESINILLFLIHNRVLGPTRNAEILLLQFKQFEVVDDHCDRGQSGKNQAVFSVKEAFLNKIAFEKVV